MIEEEKIKPGPEPDNTESPQELNSESSNVHTEIIKPTIPSSEIKYMEVHHHPNVEKKNFKEYFFEFIMIFLAVTMGFIAENVREHMVERQQEKQYMKSMIEDIEMDTAMLKSVVQKALFVIKKIDTAMNIVQNEKFDEASVYTLYRVNLSMFANFSPGFIDRTSEELKNSGSMRLIHNKSVTDGIVNYWNSTDALIAINASLNDYKSDAREKTYSVFNQKYYSERPGETYLNRPDPKLMTNNSFQLTELANRLSHIKNLILNVYIPLLKAQGEVAKKLISMIQKEYNLH